MSCGITSNTHPILRSFKGYFIDHPEKTTIKSGEFVVFKFSSSWWIGIHADDANDNDESAALDSNSLLSALCIRLNSAPKDKTKGAIIVTERDHDYRGGCGFSHCRMGKYTGSGASDKFTPKGRVWAFGGNVSAVTRYGELVSYITDTNPIFQTGEVYRIRCFSNDDPNGNYYYSGDFITNIDGSRFYNNVLLSSIGKAYDADIGEGDPTVPTPKSAPRRDLKQTFHDNMKKIVTIVIVIFVIVAIVGILIIVLFIKRKSKMSAMETAMLSR